VAVGDAVVPELLRPDDFDVNSAGSNVLDGVGDEPAGRVAGKAWVGRGQDRDARHLSTRKTAYPSEPSVSCLRRGVLHAAQKAGSADTCRKSSM